MFFVLLPFFGGEAERIFSTTVSSFEMATSTSTTTNPPTPAALSPPPTRTRQFNILPTEPLQLPARVHYSKTDANGKRIVSHGIFHHCDDLFGNRKFIWEGRARNSMSIFEFDNVIYVKPTTVQHQFRRDKKGQPISGKGWNAIFVSDFPIPSTNKHNKKKSSSSSSPTLVRYFTLHHYRLSGGFRNSPTMTNEMRDSFCRRAREHYKSDAFVTLLGPSENNSSSLPPLPSLSSNPPPPVSTITAPQKQKIMIPKRKHRLLPENENNFKSLTEWLATQLPTLLSQASFPTVTPVEPSVPVEWLIGEPYDFESKDERDSVVQLL